MVRAEGGWRRNGKGLVPVRWVCLEGREGTLRPEYPFCTDPTWCPEAIASAYTQQSSIEVTFQQVTRHLGLRGLRVWTEQSVPRAAPLVFGLHSLITILYVKLRRPSGTDNRPGDDVGWQGMASVTFTDALCLAVYHMCSQVIFSIPPLAGAGQELDPEAPDLLLNTLARAA